MSAKMQYCFDGDGDAIIRFGDFVLLAIIDLASIRVYVSSCALIADALNSSEPWDADVGFTSYNTIPQLREYTEIHVPRAVNDDCSRQSTDPRERKIYLTLFDLRNTNCRKWTPVPDHVQHTVCEYLHQLMAY